MVEPTSHYTQVRNLRIHYLEAGRGEPVVLIHGFPTSSHLWRNVIPELAKTHRAIAIDLPGYGLSDKPLDVAYDFTFFEKVIEGFLDALDIDDTALAVHDLGGPIGLFWAVRHPHRLRKLVLLNTLVYPETSWAVKLFLTAMRTPRVRDFIVSQRGIVGAMKLGVVHKERLTREVLTPYTAPFRDAPARKALIKAGSGLGSDGLAEIARMLSSLQAPVRIIYGEKDRALPDVAKTMERVKQNLPGTEVTPLPNCGHFLQEDEPERVGRLMSEFLNRADFFAGYRDFAVPPAPRPVSRAAAPPKAVPSSRAAPSSAAAARAVPEEAVELVNAINDWAHVNIDLPPAAVTPCEAPSFPEDPQAVARLLHPDHQDFLDEATDSGLSSPHAGESFRRDVPDFDPTEHCHYARPPDHPASIRAKSAATAYFAGRKVDLLETIGTETSHYDFNFDLLVALDPQSSLIFSFIWNLED